MARIFLNWIECTFASDAYGDARYAWIDTNMAHCIALAVEVKK